GLAQDRSTAGGGQPFAFWEVHRNYVIGGGLMVLLQGAAMVSMRLERSERMRSEDRLLESRQRYLLAIESAPAGMLMLDRSGPIGPVNPPIETLLRYTT